MPDIMSAVDIASEFREELANLNEKAVGDSGAADNGVTQL